MTETQPIIKFALPAGSLKEGTIELFRQAGFNIGVRERSYIPTINDPEIECILVRAQEIPRYVEEGVVDVGITGEDWVVESGAKVIRVAELHYSKNGSNTVRLVVAAPVDSSIQTIKDLRGKRIATEFVELTKKYLKKKGVRAKVEFSWGATEVKPPKLADAIVELTDSGASLKANNLKIIATVLESTTRVIVNRSSWRTGYKQRKIKNIVLLLEAALHARGMVGIKMNVEKKNLKELIDKLPSLHTPTISDLSDRAWVAVESIIPELVVRELIPQLKTLGAEGIIEYPLNKVVR
jgi:ATP phosphoribosyltransferase